jgi:hypothetical protein
MKKLFRSLASLCLLVLVAAWSPNYKEIADLRNYPQNAYSYISKATAYQRLISAGEQNALDTEYNTKYFFPWHHLGTTGYSLKDAEWAFQDLRSKEGFGETKQRRPTAWFDELKEYAGLENFPNRLMRAITVRATSLRMLPTEKPFFYSFYLDGEGYPFDNIQHSELQPNTPIFVDHLSRDGAWALVESHHGLGWMRVDDLAYVSASFVSKWETGVYAALIKDDVPIVTEKGMYLFKASVGSQFPVIAQTASDFIILAAASNEGRMAGTFRAKLPRTKAALKPFPLTPYNLATIANAMLGKPYGWGGMYGNRDCSSLTKDFYAPFGIFLPTNSTDQVKFGRSSLDLGKLSGEQKKRSIMAHGVPFLTLVGMKGHAMIYIGNYRNQPMILHTFWGVRTADEYNSEGRHLVAKGCITTLQAGWDVPNRNPDGELLNKVYKLAYVTDLSR